MPCNRSVLFTCCALLGITRMVSAGGTLDRTFGTDGIVRIESGAWGDRFVGQGATLALDPENPDAIAVAATVPVASGIETYTAAVAPTGTLLHTTSFGVGTSSSFLFFSRLLADTADPTHRLYAVGARYQTAAPQYAFAVARLTALGGGLDPAWGGGTPVVTVVPGVTQARAVALALQLNGKLVVVGQAGDQFNQTAVARYDATGALDPTFGSGGTVVVSSGFAEGVSVQDDGALLLAGNFSDETFSGFGVMRLLPDGSPDPSFGPAGLRVTALKGRYTQGMAVAVTALADGRIAAAGGDWDPASQRGAMAAVRFLADGSLDPTFGRHGRVRKGVGRSSVGSAVAFFSDGALLIAGAARRRLPQPYPDVALLRLDARGRPDRTYGHHGKVQTPAVSESEGLAVHDVVIDSAGRVTVVATSADGSDKATLLARYVP